MSPEKNARIAARRPDRVVGNEVGPPGPLEPPEAFEDYPPCVVCHEAADYAGRWCAIHAPEHVRAREETP